MEVYIVATVSEDNYINVDSVWQTYSKANARADELMDEDDREWEVICSEVELVQAALVG
jgi:hypothetical protein